MSLDKHKSKKKTCLVIYLSFTLKYVIFLEKTILSRVKTPTMKIILHVFLFCLGPKLTLLLVKNVFCIFVNIK